MGLSGLWRIVSARAFRAGLRPCVCRRGAINLLSVAVLLLSTAVTSWHQIQIKTAADEIAGLELVFGGEFNASICHHGDNGASQTPGEDQSLPCKEHCLLILAFQNAPALAPSGLSWPAQSGNANALAQPTPSLLAPEREHAEVGRPRAPPLA